MAQGINLGLGASGHLSFVTSSTQASSSGLKRFSVKDAERASRKARKVAKAVRTKMFEFVGTTTYNGVRVYWHSNPHYPLNPTVRASGFASIREWRIDKEKSVEEIASMILLDIYI